MTLWYVARAAGIMAFVLFTLATTLGALSSGRARTRGGRSLSRRVFVQYLHRAAAVTGLGLIAVHVTTIVLDSKSGVAARAALVPMTSGYRPVAVALGSVAMYIVVLAAILGAARGRLASSSALSRRWRLLHSSAYVGWGLSLGHGLLAGTDSARPLVRLLYVGSLLIVVAAVLGRVWSQSRHEDDYLVVSRRVVRSVVSGGLR